MSSDAATRSTAQMAAFMVGVVFLLVGIAGFIPGVTTHTSDLSAAGTDSGAKLLDIFQTSVLHNIVHLAFGVIGLVAARAWRSSTMFLGIGGVVYLVLTLYGVLIDQASDANFVPVNNADNWLHLALGLGMLALALITREHDTSDAR